MALPLPPGDALTIPGNAVIFRAEGTRVALLGADNRVSLRPVKVGRNFGGSDLVPTVGDGGSQSKQQTTTDCHESNQFSTIDP